MKLRMLVSFDAAIRVTWPKAKPQTGTRWAGGELNVHVTYDAFCLRHCGFFGKLK